MVKQLATEWAKYHINVNAVAPTFIRTELVRHYLEDREFYNGLVSRIPLGRVGEPVDVAAATLFLASPAADFITGHVLMVDGGVTATQ
jgi:gluconate 5-dehydrogenase